MGTEPLVSVVIPVFNAERFLGEAIESVLDQTYSPIEVIVVDDGSTDSSAEIARGFEGVTVLEQENAGPGAARNRGVAAAQGELLAFLDADDVLPPDKVERQVRYLADHPGAGCVLGRQELLLEPGAPRPAWGTIPDELARRNPDVAARGILEPLSLMTRRPIFDAVGEFSTEFGEDVDWLCRAIGAGIQVDTIDAVVLLRRVHDRNLTHDIQRSRLAMFRALRDQAARTRANTKS